MSKQTYEAILKAPIPVKYETEFIFYESEPPRALISQKLRNPCHQATAISVVVPVKTLPLGLPWWRSDWESACQCRGHGFEPWSGKIPHAAEQQSPWATTTEPARLESVLRNKRGRDSERPTHRDEEWPPLATTRESPRAATKTQHSQK